MGKLRSLGVFVGALALMARAALCQVPGERVLEPRDAIGRPVVELSDFVALVVPPRGFEEIWWDYLVDGPVKWVSDGVEYIEGDLGEQGDDKGSWFVRRGLARITINGARPTVLRQTYEERPWSIELRSPDLLKNGPKSIFISVDCFGSLLSNCEFDMAAIAKSPSLSAELVCQPGAGSARRVYDLRVNGKPPALLVYDWDGGSGGGSSWLEVHPPRKKAELCRPMR